MGKAMVTAAPALLSLLQDIFCLLGRDATSAAIAALIVMRSCCNARLRKSPAKPLTVSLVGTRICNLSSFSDSCLRLSVVFQTRKWWDSTGYEYSCCPVGPQMTVGEKYC